MFFPIMMFGLLALLVKQGVYEVHEEHSNIDLGYYNQYLDGQQNNSPFSFYSLSEVCPEDYNLVGIIGEDPGDLIKNAFTTYVTSDAHFTFVQFNST